MVARILIFENDPEIRSLFTGSLNENAGMDLLVADQGEDLFSSRDLSDFDAAVIDWDSCADQVDHILENLHTGNFTGAIILLHQASSLDNQGVATLIRNGVTEFVEKTEELWKSLPEFLEGSIQRFEVRQQLSELERRSMEWKKSIAMDAFESTVHTVSHYINNSLTSIFGRIQLLQQARFGNKPVPEEDLWQDLTAIEECAQNIKAVVDALQEVMDLSYTTYGPGLSMVNIEQKIQQRLEELGIKDSVSE